MRVEVGYGLEGLVPDITAGRIINESWSRPSGTGTTTRRSRGAVNAFLQTIAGEREAGAGPGSAEGSPPPGRRAGSSKGQKVFSVIAVVFFLILFITNPRLALWLLFSLLSGGGGGGGGRGGGVVSAEAAAGPEEAEPRAPGEEREDTMLGAGRRKLLKTIDQERVSTPFGRPRNRRPERSGCRSRRSSGGASGAWPSGRSTAWG